MPYHCPGYKGAITGPAFDVAKGVDRLGRYSLQRGWDKVLENTNVKVRAHFGLGPIICWSKVPSVSESQVRVASEMLAAIANPMLTKTEDNTSPNGQDILYSGAFCGQSNYPERHGKKILGRFLPRF